MTDGKQYTIPEMIGKGVFTNDNVLIGKVTKIIDQPDSEIDNECLLGDIKTDLFQIVVELQPNIFERLTEPTEILFSSQTIEKVSDEGFKLVLSKTSIDSYISQSF
ncbi:MAG: hypothetical protein ACFFDW_04805 [Candidatus Thorarchaeota archaeon]